ncbi:MAG: PAS domain-containing protein [Rubrivivax sp.]|nr:PAS domain-containing protein [Rubrivivax sp.]
MTLPISGVTGATGDDFLSLFDFLPVGAFRSTPGGTLLAANPALARLHGFGTVVELQAALTDSAASWTVDAAQRHALLCQPERDGRITAAEYEARRVATGERIWVSENAHVVRAPDGTVRYYEGTLEDITARVRERQRLQHSQAQLQQLVALIPGAVFRASYGAEGSRHYTFMSEGVRALYGISPQDALTDKDALTRHRHAGDAERTFAQTEAAIADNAPLAGEHRICLDDGTEKWVQVLSTPAADENGERVRVGLLLDVTAAKRTEAALLANGELWKRALESSGDGVWDWQVQDDVQTLSAPCRSLYGWGPDKLPDSPQALDALVHPDDLPRVLAQRNAHLTGRTPSYDSEHRVRCADGRWKWILSRGIVISRSADGSPLRMVGTHTDVTAERQAEALRHERDRAAAADLAKSQFLSRVSHELRTPLNAILGFAQLLALEPQAQQRQDWVSHVLTSGRHLLALMDDILDLSSVQTGRLPLALQTVPLGAAVDEAWTMLSVVAQARGVVLSSSVGGVAGASDGADDAPAYSVRADPRRLRQVLINLLSNAIKYNRPGGGVRVSAQRQKARADADTDTDANIAAGAVVLLQVADDGPGLSEEQQLRLFNPFERLGAERGPVAGSGLGLALTRQLLEAMGGRITVQSQPGQGACFTVQLPAGG